MVQPTEMTLWTPRKKRVFPEGSVRVHDGGEKCKHWLYFLLEVVILLPSEVMIGKKLLVDEKRTACLKQIICLLGVIWKVSNRKTLSGGTVCFLEKCLLSIFKFDALNNLSFFFPTSWLVLNQLSWNVLLFSCYPIGQLCLSDPSYNSSTVVLGSLSNNDSNGNEDGKRAIKNNFRLTKQQLCMCVTLFALSLQSLMILLKAF